MTEFIMNWLFGVLFAVAVSVTGAAVDLTSPAVFNAIFYITANVEVWHAGARNVTSAKYHWLHHGIDEGLQACGSFHSAQYIRRYSDVEKAHGLHGYRQAIEHYLTTGQHEHRVGYLEGGYGGRWTVSDAHHKLFVSASARMGAAIDSLVWNNHEFINSIDHGRELQMAVWPAFWFRAVNYIGEKPCPGGMNTENTYRHPFSKKVTLECPGISQSCLHFRSTFTIAGVFPHYTMLQMVAPAGYLTGDFTVWRSYDYSSGHLVAYHTKMPVVLSSPDKHFAMGVFASPKQDTDEDMYYGRFVLSKDKITADTNKWNVVFRKHTLPAGTTHVFNYDTYICVGTLNDVTACLKKLTQAHHADLVG
ncbi:uncharacterized protein [Littorina saxatilis]|uniref:uncharacterized protein isoform X3 n=1 Tax=Littorina saxatilis TaxID=31220 RepID=UPI0038B52CF3